VGKRRMDFNLDSLKGKTWNAQLWAPHSSTASHVFTWYLCNSCSKLRTKRATQDRLGEGILNDDRIIHPDFKPDE
jgi:hypothetical protein